MGGGHDGDERGLIVGGALGFLRHPNLRTDQARPTGPDRGFAGSNLNRWASLSSTGAGLRLQIGKKWHQVGRYLAAIFNARPDLNRRVGDKLTAKVN